MKPLNCMQFCQPAGWLTLAAVFAAAPATVRSQDTNSPSTINTNTPSATDTNVTQLGETTVVGHLNEARTSIVPNLGATAYKIDATQIATELKGGNAPFNEVILRAPGVAEDSAAN